VVPSAAVDDNDSNMSVELLYEEPQPDPADGEPLAEVTYELGDEDDEDDEVDEDDGAVARRHGYCNEQAIDPGVFCPADDVELEENLEAEDYEPTFITGGVPWCAACERLNSRGLCADIAAALVAFAGVTRRWRWRVKCWQNHRA
jgi:hypothetical protein